MTPSQFALIVLVAAAVILGLGAIAVQVVPMSGPGADVAIGRAVAGSYAIWSSISLSALALVFAVRARRSVGAGYLVLGLAPGAIWIVAWLWLSIAHQLDPGSSPASHCLFVEVG